MSELVKPRTEQLLLERAIRKGWDLSQEHLEKAKQTALELMSHREHRARARGVSLTIAMKNADDREGRHEDKLEQTASSGPGVTVNGDVSVTVGADVIASVLASRKALAERVKPPAAGVVVESKAIVPVDGKAAP